MPGIGTGELQRREVAVLEALANGMAPRDACLAAGYAPSTAAAKSLVISERVLKRSPMIAALDRRRVTTDRLAKAVSEGLDSTKITRLVVSGEVKEFTDADGALRHRFLETAIRLRGEDLDRCTTVTEETFEQRIRRLRGIGAA